MPEPNETHEPSQNTPNWVDVSTLFVLTGTLLAVIWYACEMRAANILTRQAIETQTRPYIQIRLDPYTEATYMPTVVRMIGGGIVNTTSFKFFVSNIGKLPANANIRSIVKYSVLGFLAHLSIPIQRFSGVLFGQAITAELLPPSGRNPSLRGNMTTFEMESALCIFGRKLSTAMGGSPERAKYFHTSPEPDTPAERTAR